MFDSHYDSEERHAKEVYDSLAGAIITEVRKHLGRLRTARQSAATRILESKFARVHQPDSAHPPPSATERLRIIFEDDAAAKQLVSPETPAETLKLFEAQVQRLALKQPVYRGRSCLRRQQICTVWARSHCTHCSGYNRSTEFRNVVHCVLRSSVFDVRGPEWVLTDYIVRRFGGKIE